MRIKLRLYSSIYGVLGLLLSTLSLFAQENLNSYQISGFAQGTSFQIQYFAKNEKITKLQIDSIFLVIDNSLSLYQKESILQKFNLSAGRVKVDSHLKSVFLKSRRAYKKSEYQFDPSVVPLMNLWGLGGYHLSNFEINQTSIQEALNKLGFSEVYLRKNKLYKTRPEIQLDFNGIAQGYTVDYLSYFLRSKGLKSFLVELGGELYLQGLKPTGQKFKLGVLTPPNYKGADFIVEFKRGALTTSAVYEQGIEYAEGWKSHIINPKTGHPIQSQIISVSLFGKKAVWADAFDQVCLGKSPSEAVDFASDKLKMGALIFYLDENQNIQSLSNRRFQKILINSAQF